MTERPAPNYSDAERELQRVEEKAVNDRTKAIVEAAERLAKGLDLSVMPNGAIYRTGHAKECECDHDDELDELLIPLGKALSLPSPQWTRTPPSEPGVYWHRYAGRRPYLVSIGDPRAPEVGEQYVLTGAVSAWSVVGGEWFPVRIEEPPA